MNTDMDNNEKFGALETAKILADEIGDITDSKTTEAGIGASVAAAMFGKQEADSLPAPNLAKALDDSVDADLQRDAAEFARYVESLISKASD